MTPTPKWHLPLFRGRCRFHDSTAQNMPFSYYFHVRQLSLFSMICRLKEGDNVLAVYGRHILATQPPSSKSWFSSIQSLCLQYCLPHPITFLDNPPTKQAFKNLVKSRIINFWEEKFRSEAVLLPSSTSFLSTCPWQPPTHYLHHVQVQLKRLKSL